MVDSGSDIQTENGFVQIHPTILELLATRQLSGREFRCLLFLFRKTYGYHKKEDRISLSQWEQGTGIPRTRVGAVLDELVKQRLIYRIEHGTKRPAAWGFNKHFETWQCNESVTLEGVSLEQDSAKTVTPAGDTSVTLEGVSSNATVTLQGDKTVTLQGDYKRKKEKSNVSVPKEPKVQTPNGVMFERLCFILFKHTNTKNGLTDKQRGLLNSETKRLRELGATPDDLGDWYKQEWRTEWPGNQGQHPRVEQVIAGVTARVERRNGKCSELDETPTANGTVKDFDVAQLLGGA
jgi:phage replication O-like protein O